MVLLSELDPKEYEGFFSRYLKYIKGSESTDEVLASSRDAIINHYSGLNEIQLNHVYQTGKWTPKEVLRHLIDTERVMAYRAMRFSRNDKTPLPGFEQNDYVWNSHANEESIQDLLAEYRATRESSRLLFKSMSHQEAERMGTASSLQLSARTFPFIIAGHDRHHLQILVERYL